MHNSEYFAVHQATELVPQLTERMDNLTVLAETVDRIGYQLIFDAKELQESITVTRETAARVCEIIMLKQIGRIVWMLNSNNCLM